MDKPEEFDLKELCEAAHVTERTVRYYIAEGLLPTPVGVRSQSRYTAEHLERLQLIQRLKEQDFSLRQIKGLLDGKTATGLKPLLDPAYFSGEADEQSDPPLPIQLLPAQDFNRNLNETVGPPLSIFQSLNQPGINPSGRVETKAPHSLKMGFTRNWTTDRPQLPDQEADSPEPAPDAPAANELSQLWEKLTIAPGVELMLDKTIADRHRALLANLAEQIKRKLGQ